MPHAEKWESFIYLRTSPRNCNSASKRSAQRIQTALRIGRLATAKKWSRLNLNTVQVISNCIVTIRKLCDCIVCWHDWHDAPRRIEIIELKKFFGVPFKVWIQAAVESEQHWLDECNRTDWVLSSRVTEGDLLLMYRGSPKCSITDVFRFSGTGKVYKTGWRKGKFFSEDIERVCKLDAPIFLEEMRNHRVLRTSSFIRANMRGRGGLLVSEYWSHLYAMLYARNPKHRRTLAKYAPEKLFA
jgi:hypothetical protein